MDVILIAIVIFVVLFFVWATAQANGLSFKRKNKRSSSKSEPAPFVEKEEKKEVKPTKIKKKAIIEEKTKLADEPHQISEKREKPLVAVGGGVVEQVFTKPVVKDEEPVTKPSKDKSLSKEDEDFERELEELIRELEGERDANSKNQMGKKSASRFIEPNNPKPRFEWEGMEDIFADELLEDDAASSDLTAFPVQKSLNTITNPQIKLNTRQQSEGIIPQSYLGNITPTSKRRSSITDYGSNMVVDTKPPKSDASSKLNPKELFDKSSFDERLEKGFDTKVTKPTEASRIVIKEGDKNANVVAKKKRRQWL